MPDSRARTSNSTRLMLNSDSAPTIVWNPKPSSIPVALVRIPSRPIVLAKNTSVASAITSSGTMTLMYVRPSNGRRNHFGARCRPSAAIVPTTVEMTAVKKPTIRLLPR